jgi:hypothetical protein
MASFAASNLATTWRAGRAADEGAAGGGLRLQPVSVSNADLERILALHRSYFRELRPLVAKAQPPEAVGLVTMSLVELGSAAPASSG